MNAASRLPHAPSPTDRTRNATTDPPHHHHASAPSGTPDRSEQIVPRPRSSAREHASTRRDPRRPASRKSSARSRRRNRTCRTLTCRNELTEDRSRWCSPTPRSSDAITDPSGSPTASSCSAAWASSRTAPRMLSATAAVVLCTAGTSVRLRTRAWTRSARDAFAWKGTMTLPRTTSPLPRRQHDIRIITKRPCRPGSEPHVRPAEPSSR